MGLLKETMEIVKALNLPKGFSVCELGNQQMDAGKPVDAWYRKLGCGRYVSIDGDGRGTVSADLNRPLTALNLGTFDLVTDFGTGEHIFDQAQVWRTVHELTKPGGFIAFDRPHQGYTKHCFYLVNPCLFTDLAKANNYRVVSFLKTQTPRGYLLRGVYQRRTAAAAFCLPQQGRYQAVLGQVAN